MTSNPIKKTVVKTATLLVRSTAQKLSITKTESILFATYVFTIADERSSLNSIYWSLENSFLWSLTLQASQRWSKLLWESTLLVYVLEEWPSNVLFVFAAVAVVADVVVVVVVFMLPKGFESCKYSRQNNFPYFDILFNMHLSKSWHIHASILFLL